MILGPRCDAIIYNHCQCPNAAEADSKFCKLHNAVVNATQSKPAATLNLQHKEFKAPLSNKN
jgi:hypothetical protein